MYGMMWSFVISSKVKQDQNMFSDRISLYAEFNRGTLLELDVVSDLPQAIVEYLQISPEARCTFQTLCFIV